MTHSVPKPLLEEISGGHTVVGEKLVLSCKIKTQIYVTIVWITPTGPPDATRMETSPQRKSIDASSVVQELTINQTTLKDKGVYYCNVSDNQNHFSVNSINITIYGPKEHFINLTEENNVYDISVIAGEPVVRWRIDVQGHPQPKLNWLSNNNETIPEHMTDKYVINMTLTEAILEIKDVAITDYGHYTLVAENKFETKTLVLFLNVTDKPTVIIEADTFHMVNQNASIKCIVAAYPTPTIYWSFKPCLDNSCTFQQINESSSATNGLQIISRVSIKSLNTGLVKCLARNSIGEDSLVQTLYVTDVRNGFDIFGFDSTVILNAENDEAVIAVGENVQMICGASVYNYTTDMKWKHDDKLIETSDRYRIDVSHTDYSDRLILNMAKVKFVDAGRYSCLVKTKNGKTVYKNMTLQVSEPSKPVIKNTNMNKDMEITLPNRVEFFCKVWGVPKPTVTWFANDEIIHPSRKIYIRDSNQRIHFSSLEFQDEGTYKCVASNKVGKVSKQINLKFKNKPQTDQMLKIVISCLVIFVIVILIYIGFKIRKEKKLQRELRIAGLANFEKGALENLNPELGIDDQAELLPYDKKWEFPIEKLKLGKQLGSGAFGVVMKGVAKGIIDGEENTTVAVKMVKKNAGHTYIKALASELKIMVHLGKHLNVVNLLGACTKNVAKRELLVIVEFCRYGNLQNYLLRHRDNFVDQVNPKTGHIDYTIGQEILERTYSVSSNRSNSQSPYMKYAALSFSNNQSGSSQVPQMIDYRAENYNGATGKTDVTTVSMSPNSGDDEVVLSNNSSVQPEWRSNYRGDYRGNVKPICTTDLLAWAFQVSRGMEYLASRRVLHGDLAARNILLADNNVVKICDFGLAKSMYKSDNYKKKGDGPLPVKWMAIESIRDKVFSTQSDVWSFGIVLWEFFSLARTPYPGMEADERLYNKLLDGYRMESPEYSPKEIYKMMLDCWQAKPLARPTFMKLSERIGSLLEDTVRKHYIDLNDPYLLMNTQWLEEGHSDYLAMVNPPNFENLSSPQYVNDLPPNEGTPGYLCMKSANIFSPRADDSRVFDFEVTGKGKKEKKPEGGTGNELVPMLPINNDSDCDSSSCNSPVVPNSFSNPSYHLPPIVEKNQVNSDSDNYVNMPQSKSVLKDTNPFVTKLGKDLKDANYVNSNSRDWESIKL
jgi:FMS-like tyrosine kinase 1